MVTANEDGKVDVATKHHGAGDGNAVSEDTSVPHLGTQSFIRDGFCFANNVCRWHVLC